VLGENNHSISKLKEMLFEVKYKEHELLQICIVTLTF